MSRVYRFLFLVALLGMIAFPVPSGAAPSGAAPAEIRLQQDRSVPDLGAAMQVLLDDGRGLAATVRAFREGEFGNNPAAATKRGMSYQPVWTGVVLNNAAPDDGRGLDDWILEIRTYGIVAVDAYLIRADGLTETILQHSIREPFDAAHYSGTRLHAQPVRLRPGEAALLMTKLVFGPVARPDLSLMTPADHEAGVFAVSIGISAWYAFLIACLIFHFGFSLSMRSRVGMAYGVVLTLALVFIAYLDGFLFRFVYPGHPGRHLGIGISLLLGVSATGFAAAALSIRDLATAPGGERAYRAGAGVSLAAIAAVPIVVPEIMANVAYAAFALMLVGQAVAVPRWKRVFGMPRKMLGGLTIALAIAATAMLAMVLGGGSAGWMPFAWQIKTLFAVTSLWTIAALSLGLVSMRRDHEATLMRELEAVSERERVARDLLDAERNYSHARALADSRRARLASASHDFRQPLASLRLTLGELSGRLDAGQRERLAEVFDYMEDISSDLLDETRSDADADGHDPVESYPLSLILGTVARMFGKEAAEKDLALRVVSSSRHVAVPPLVLTRIVGNLVSNAVKYTQAGDVLVGVRSGEPGTVRIVVRDTGPGMSGDDLDRLSKAYAKGDGSSGTGLGLAICHDLVAQHGLEIEARSWPGKGTCFAVAVPVSDPATGALAQSEPAR